MSEVEKILIDIDARKDEALYQKKKLNSYAMFTLSDACREKGETYSSIRRIATRGNTTLSSLSRLANVLGVKLAWLLDGDVDVVDWANGEFNEN